MQDPTGDEGFSRGGWFSRIDENDREAWAELEFAEARGAEAMLLGRGSYEFFASRWPSRTGAWADRLNTMPKYVISSTLSEPEWSNSTVLNGDVIGEVAGLRENLTGDIVVYASRPLVRTLIDHDLADELRLIVFPVVIGDGERLFGETVDQKSLRLLDTETVGDGLAHLTYALVKEERR
jgi:dihydrofolate reductase